MARSKKEKKIFVLDTSVILYDHNAVKNFQEHDVAIPITVLEELDNFKKGNDTKNFEAREFIRFIDKISGENKLQDWIPLEGTAKGQFKVQMNSRSTLDAEVVFDEKKADHRILNAALALQEEHPASKVIMVTKDINLRLKAKALNLPAEDYETGKIKNVDSLYTGKTVLNDIPSEVITRLHEEGTCPLTDVIKKGKPRKNQFFILKSERNSVLACYNPIEDCIDKVEKREVYGIRPRNAEQTFAIDAILNRDIKLLTIQGVAGSLEMRKNYRQIFLARPIVPLSNKDIGYLPGDVKSKLNPYMEPLWDNLKFIQSQFEEGDRYWNQIQEMLVKETLQIMPLAYIRGRSLSNVIFIVDEAQNLTPHEVKTIITRAGENTKIVFTGDIYQIDTPYLDTQSNGLSYLIDRVKDHKLYAHITLEKGERSELANLANELL
ncbi:MAG: PhoH family protein [Cytophagales bacterium]|nr:PhoH family protein [Cytophagales bacterium]